MCVCDLLIYFIFTIHIITIVYLFTYFFLFIFYHTEETIIFALIERSQYRKNHAIYNPKMHKLRNVYGAPQSFLEYMLLETEKLHSKVRRYTSPEEHPFYASYLPSPILPELSYPQQILLTGKSAVDVNSEVMRWYVEKIIDRLCKTGKIIN